MLIDITKSVPLKELCKITAIGSALDTAHLIEFTLSHDAMIGFATELLWMYEDINDNKKVVVSTNQLQVDPSPSQAMILEKEEVCNRYKSRKVSGADHEFVIFRSRVWI